MPESLPKKSTHPEWSVDDALALRNFLDSATGSRMLEWLKFWAPTLLDGSHVNRSLVASGEVKNHLAMMDQIISLTKDNPIPEEIKADESYPDLDDNAKWSETENVRPN